MAGVPTVNNVALTGPDGGNPWPRDPTPRADTSWTRGSNTLQDQALGAFTGACTGSEPTAGSGCSTIWPRSSASCSRIERVRALSDAVREGTPPLPDPDGPLNPLEQAGQGGVRARLRAVPRRPGQSTPQPPVVRFHDISSQCPRPVDTVTPARFDFTPCPPRLARNAGPTRSRCRTGRGSADKLGSRSRPVDRLRGSDRPRRTTGTSWTCPDSAGIRNTAPYFHNNSAATLEDVVDHYTEFFKRVASNAPPGSCRRS